MGEVLNVGVCFRPFWPLHPASPTFSLFFGWVSCYQNIWVKNLGKKLHFPILPVCGAALGRELKRKHGAFSSSGGHLPAWVGGWFLPLDNMGISAQLMMTVNFNSVLCLDRRSLFNIFLFTAGTSDTPSRVVPLRISQPSKEFYFNKRIYIVIS